MSHQSDLIATDIDAYLAEHERKELMRFITCGSVDDGKSTLIGRLLYDSKMIYEDQLAKIEKDSVVHGTTGGKFDPALLTDGLRAEREQGITIDVAYRYFSTAKRKFIIADTPGHVQYTRNMATGASTADLAIILVDARHGILEQTRRHSFIVSLLGIRHILVAVNKMDLVDYDEKVFDRIRDDYRAFGSRLDIPDLHFIPISALNGDNLVEKSVHMPWYNGSTLMSFLETVYIGSDRNLQDFRFPVQIVLRPNLDFRGFAGTVSSGVVRVGDEILALPSRKSSRIKEIVTADGNIQEAFVPMSVTLTLEDEIDISRGDMIVRPGNVPKLENRFDANIVWMSGEPLIPGKQYLFKQTTKTVPGNINTLRYRIDVNTLHRVDAPTLNLNEIGRIGITLSEPIAFDRYRRNRSTGAFIVIDRISYETVAAGMIIDRQTRESRKDHWDDDPQSDSLVQYDSKVSREERRARFGQTPVTILFTGLPGSGKSTTAYGVERALFERGRNGVVLDGQNLRIGISRDLGFSPENRSENVRRCAEIARLFNDAGLITLISLVAPEEEIRQRASTVIGAENFIVVHLNAAAELCARRNVGEREVSDPVLLKYEPPEAPDLVLDTGELAPADCIARVVDLLEKRNIIS
jgi:bifunctional enzyme CysN/CysC